jgi:hypothetical protein
LSICNPISPRLVLVVVLAAAGCAEVPPPPPPPGPPPVAAALYPPWTLHQSPEGIDLRWYPDNTPSAAANDVARRHCAIWNKSAEMVSDTRDGSAEIARYRCR